MANTKTFKGSFIGGELSPEMFGRIDDTKFQSGAASIENLIVTPLGPAEKRPGFAFVKTTKNNGPARLIPFTYSITQTMVIEIGPGYFRFHTQGKTLEYSATQPAFVPSGAVSYTIATPTVITWPGHPFSTGNSVVLAITGVAPVGHNVAYPAGLGYGPYNVLVLDANTFELTDPVTGLAAAVTAAPTYGGLAVEPNYAIGAMVSYGGATYYRPQVPPEACPFVPALDTDPATQSYWYALPADLTYEIPNTYGAADLMDIHFVRERGRDDPGPSQLPSVGAAALRGNAVDVFFDCVWAIPECPGQRCYRPHPRIHGHHLQHRSCAESADHHGNRSLPGSRRWRVRQRTDGNAHRRWDKGARWLLDGQQGSH